MYARDKRGLAASCAFIKLNKAFKISWKRPPAHAAIRYIPQGLTPADVEKAFREHATNLNFGSSLGRYNRFAVEWDSGKDQRNREEGAMTGRYLPLLCGLLGALIPAGGLHAQQSKVLNIALAGTMEHVISRQIGPAFTATTGYSLNVTRAPSIALANRIVSGELKPDVYISSDANVMQLIMGPANNDRSRWYVPFLGSRTVLMHGMQSRFNKDIDAVREGKLPWYELMQLPGLVLKRPNPVVDSGGSRAIFVFELAERHYKLPGLKQRVLGDNHNESQYSDRSMIFPLIRDGHIDIFLTYLSNPLAEGFPFLDLPEEVDQSNPSMQDWYSTVSYTSTLGQTFRGTSAAYGVTIPVAAANPTTAEAFVRLLLSEQGMMKFQRAGFYLFKELRIVGDQGAVPESIRSLVMAKRTP